MKKSELTKLIKEEIKIILKETGEMGARDIKPGGEYYEWAKQIRLDVLNLQRMTKGKVKLIDVKAYDKYMGPYAVVKINGSADQIWLWDEGKFYAIDYLKLAGSIKTLANAINGNADAYNKAETAYQQKSDDIHHGL